MVEDDRGTLNAREQRNANPDRLLTFTDGVFALVGVISRNRSNAQRHMWAGDRIDCRRTYCRWFRGVDATPWTRLVSMEVHDGTVVGV